MRLSIRFKLLVLTIGAISLVGGSISLYSINVGRERLSKAFVGETVNIANLLSTNLSDDLSNLDVFSMRLQLENARISQELLLSYVLDTEGLVLADGTSENALRGQALSDVFGLEVLSADTWISLKDEDLLRLGGPIIMADDTLVGYLYLVFSLDGINQIVADNTRSSFLITTVILGFGALLAFFLSSRFTRPIIEIAEVATALGQGKLDKRVQIKGQDELGLLGLSINKLAVDLGKTTVPKGYFNKIISSMAEMLIVVAPGYTIDTVNNAVLKTLGYQADALLGKPLNLIFSEEVDVIRDLIEKGVHKTIETSVLTQEGRHVPISFSASAMREASGQLVGVVCILQDITARREAEETTRKYSERLEQEVKERTSELQSKNEKLERYNKLFVGRELRIRDLKGRIRSFEEERN